MSGEVVKVGDEVTKWNEGDKIMATFTLGLERGASCSPLSLARAPRADAGPAETGQVDDPALFVSMLGGGCDGTLTQYRLFKATDRSSRARPSSCRAPAACRSWVRSSSSRRAGRPS